MQCLMWIHFVFLDWKLQIIENSTRFIAITTCRMGTVIIRGKNLGIIDLEFYFQALGSTSYVLFMNLPR